MPRNADANTPVTDGAPGSDAADGHATSAANGKAAAAKKNKGKKAPKQTEPPSITVKRLFPDGVYPRGEWQPYKQE